MEIIVNDVAKIEAEFIIEEDTIKISKGVIGTEQRDSFIDLFPNKGPVLINDGNRNWKLKRVSSSYSHSNDSDYYDVSVSFKEYTKDDERKENKPDVQTVLLLETQLNRLRIDALKKILLKEGLVKDEEDFKFSNVFDEEQIQELTEKYQEDFLEKFENIEKNN